MDQSHLAEARQNAEEVQEKKPYEKPAVVFERPLEALAAACTPVGAGLGKTAFTVFPGGGSCGTISS